MQVEGGVGSGRGRLEARWRFLLAKSGRGGGFTLCFNLFNHHLFFYYLRWLCAWPQISVTLLKLSVLPGACGSQHGHLDSRKPGRKETHSITSTQTQAHIHTHRRHINNPPWERFGLRHFLLFLSLFFLSFTVSLGGALNVPRSR